MKRLFLVVMIIVLTGSVLYAGGDKESGETQKSGSAEKAVVFADWLSAQDAFRPAMVGALEQYQKANPDVKFTHLNWQYEQYLNQLLVLASSGDAPDVALLPFEEVPKFAQKDLLSPIDEWYTSERKNNFFPAGLKSSQYNGKFVGVPFYASGIGLLRNTRLFAEAGFNPDQPPKTWDEYLQIARQISSLGSDIYGTDVRYSGGAMVTYIWPWFVQGGGGMADADGNVTIDSEETINTVKFLAQMYKEGLNVPGAPIQREMNEQFALGKLAFLYQGPWIYKVLAVTDPNFSDYKVSKPPRGPENNGTGYHGGNLVIFNQTKDKDTALGLIEFWANDGQDAVWAAQNAVGTKNAWQEQSKRSPFAGKEGFIPDWTATYKDLVEIADFDEMVFLPESARINDIFITEVTHAVLQEKTAEQAMKDAGKEIRSILGK